MADRGVKQNPIAEKQALLSLVERREQALQVLQRQLDDIQRVLKTLQSQQRQIELLGDVCRSIEELDSAGGSHLVWQDQNAADRLQAMRRQIEKHEDAIQRAARRRDELITGIRDQGYNLEYARLALTEAREREELRAGAWVIERDPGEMSPRDTVMPWARNSAEDRRYRWSLVFTVIAAAALTYAVSLVAIPAAERPKQIKLPERMARLVREAVEPPPPPKPIEEPVPEEEIPEPETEPEPADEQTPEKEPEAREEPKVAVLSENEIKEKVRTKGILAFRDSFASQATLDTAAQLGSQARVRLLDDDAINRPKRSMVSSNAPGVESGINLADISRNASEGGAVASVEVTRVASSIDTAGAIERPQASAALAGRTDQDIQIVFDRYKSALYRLYNRELRKDPRLRGQIVLRLTIEPDGSVSFCEMQSSSMNEPQLEQQVIDRVRTFDFGAREDISAITILYPIEFMPAS